MIPVPNKIPPFARRGGFSVIELCVGILVLGVTLGSAAMVSTSSRQAYRFSMIETGLEQRLHSALRRAADELALTGEELIDPDPLPALFCADLQYQHVTIDGADVVFGPLARVRCELEPGETADGADEDGDGLVDERRLVLVRNDGEPDEQLVVLANGVRFLGAGEELNGADDDGDGLVDEPGFWVERDGGVLDLRLTLQARGPGGEILERSAATTVRMRN